MRASRSAAVVTVAPSRTNALAASTPYAGSRDVRVIEELVHGEALAVRRHLGDVRVRRAGALELRQEAEEVAHQDARDPAVTDHDHGLAGALIDDPPDERERAIEDRVERFPARPLDEAVLVPVEEAFRDRIATIRFGKSDTLLAVPKSVDAKEPLLEFAEALLRRVVECRHTMGLLDVVNLGISVAHGDCKFELLTGEPVPDSLDSDGPTWYQAAKLLVKAEKVSGHERHRGGVILMTDEADAWFGTICKRKKMSEFDSTLKEGDDYELNIFDGFESKAQGK